MTSPQIQWYPGHIAKAEKALLEQLKRVDVVLEVRDARIPLTTRHPRVSQWVGNKARILVLNREDMIPVTAQERWRRWLEEAGETPYFTNAQHGQGVAALARAAQAAGAEMNQRRCDRGMRPRPVRAVVIGFPNVGKSALINRLLKRKAAPSARRAGVTRQLRWIRLSDQLELLDAPGIIPAQLTNQDAAVKLAICDDIGEAAYEAELVAAHLIDLLKDEALGAINHFHPEQLGERYGLSAQGINGAAYVAALADHRYQGDKLRTARQILNDFRVGHLGNLVLELPPD